MAKMIKEHVGGYSTFFVCWVQHGVFSYNHCNDQYGCFKFRFQSVSKQLIAQELQWSASFLLIIPNNYPLFFSPIEDFIEMKNEIGRFKYKFIHNFNILCTVLGHILWLLQKAGIFSHLRSVYYNIITLIHIIAINRGIRWFSSCTLPRIKTHAKML